MANETVFKRYQGNPIITSAAVPNAHVIMNSAIVKFKGAYAGVFRIVNVPTENLHPLVMIECPRLLFPFAREIIATSVRDGGFPPLMLDPVDFVGLYRSNMERQAAAQAAQGKPS